MITRIRRGTAADDEPTVRFRRRHGELGIGISVVTAIALISYIWADPASTHRVFLTWLGLGVIVAMVPLAPLVRTVVRSRAYLPLFFAWSLANLALILLAVTLDGGAGSPIAPVLVLPVVYAGLAYPYRVVLALGAIAIVGYLGISWLGPGRVTSASTMIGVTIGLVTLMASESARHRAAQQREARALTARLRREATSDPLTGCLNHRGFDGVLAAEIARALRYRRPLTLVLLDLDHLKDINDSAGHLTGDAALARLGAALRGVCRQTDVAARLGGDEFALLLPETTAGEALELAHRLQAELATGSDEAPEVRLSGGVAAVGRDVRSAADLLHAADTALYAAKAAGRNCLRVAGEPTERQDEARYA